MIKANLGKPKDAKPLRPTHDEVRHQSFGGHRFAVDWQAATKIRSYDRTSNQARLVSGFFMKIGQSARHSPSKRLKVKKINA